MFTFASIYQQKVNILSKTQYSVTKITSFRMFFVTFSKPIHVF